MRKSPTILMCNALVTAPALFLSLAFATGALLRHKTSLGIVPSGALAIACLYLLQSTSGRRWTAILLATALSGFIRMSISNWSISDNYRQFLPYNRCFATLHLIIVEAPLLEGTLAELDAGRGQVIAKIQSIQTLADEMPRRASGHLPLTTSVWELRETLRTLPIGTELKAKAVLLPIPSDAPMYSAYHNSLLSKGFHHECDILEYEPLKPSQTCPGPSLQGTMRKLRLALGARLVRGFRSQEAARLTLALGLGMSEFTPRDIRQRQVVSGTVHVFAISGMHIGMVTLLLTALLRASFLPLGWQRVLLALSSAAYTLLTGASVSSLRALLMVWLALYAATRFRRTAWLNTLGCAALLSLLFHPLQLLDLGFQYSHLTVLVLLLSAPIVQEHLSHLTERDVWLPRHLRPQLATKILQWFVGGLDASFLAWLGSLGISLHLNPHLSLGAPLLNLPLGLLIAFALALCPLRLLLGFLAPCLDDLWARTLENVMQLTAAVSESGFHSAFQFSHPMIPAWTVPLYYLVFFTALLLCRKLIDIKQNKSL